MKEHVKANWKKYALLAVGAAAAYYGVDPEAARQAATQVYSIVGPLLGL